MNTSDTLHPIESGESSFKKSLDKYEQAIQKTYKALDIPFNRYRILDLCSGIGGFSLGLLTSGLAPFCEISSYCDIDPFCQNILKHHFGKPVLSDIKELEIVPNQYDIIQASIPCQPHSQASGKWRKGGADERDLGDEFIRLVATGKPVGFLLENVPGFRTSDKGNYFKQFLTKLSQQTSDDPYLIEWGVYSAAQVGAVHLRKRFWVLGYKLSQLQSLQSLTSNQPLTQPLTQYLHKPFVEQLPLLINSFPSFFPSSLSNNLLTHKTLQNHLEQCCDTDTKPYRKQHLKAYGNAIVPMVAAKIWQRFFHTLHNLLPDCLDITLHNHLPITLHAFQGFLPTEACLIPKVNINPKQVVETPLVLELDKWGESVPTKDKIWLPTPLASNAIHPGHRSYKKGSNKHLPHALVPWRVPYTTRKENDKLNPDFVRQMMGFPEDWLLESI